MDGGGEISKPARNVPSPAYRSALEPQRDRDGTLTHMVEMLLDKGLVINADITVSLAGVELLGIRIRAALASFDTAARYGLDFPSGTDRSTAAWRDSLEGKETCPQCGKAAPVQQLLHEFCPWCGWRSALALESAEESRGELAEESGGGPREEPGEESRAEQRRPEA